MIETMDNITSICVFYTPMRSNLTYAGDMYLLLFGHKSISEVRQ